MARTILGHNIKGEYPVEKVLQKLQTNKIFVSAEDHETGGAAMDEIDANTVGGELTIGFNSTLLLDILKHQKTEELHLLTSGPLNAALFKPVGETETETMHKAELLLAHLSTPGVAS